MTSPQPRSLLSSSRGIAERVTVELERQAGIRQHERVAAAKKWVDIADRLGAGHVRVFAGGIPKGGTEVQAVDWAVEVREPKGFFLAWKTHSRINLDCGNFRKDGYKEVERCAPFAAATHIKTNMSSPDGNREAANWFKLFGILANAGYRGYVSMEFEPNDKDNPIARYAPELIRCARMYSGV